MAVPKKRTTASSQGARRSHDAISPVNVTTCTNCAKPVRQHQVCLACGTYRGRKVLKTA